PEKRLSYFSLAMGILWLSNIIGQITGANLLSSTSIDSGVISIISLTAVWILAMVSILLLLLFIRSHTLLLAMSITDTTPSLLEKIHSFSVSCGLSPRETEILIEFAHGRSASYISNSFYISEHTVKTHLRRIYSKAKIHNRQELLNLIDAAG
ncbi:MAG: helix-turn-helix transcriptional regulator, partial [Coriobacteriaceae bacterium]|nr:helix-turn-helix transcriptional regulator [Coriobacteriaceae bacterium]